MQGDDLELVSTRELIKELLSRSTFVGAIIWSSDQHIKDGQGHQNFNVSTSVENESLLHLLDNVSNRLRCGDYQE